MYCEKTMVSPEYKYCRRGKGWNREQEGAKITVELGPVTG